MELIPVKATDPYYAEAERLMTDAFPPEERRPLDRQRQYTDHNPLFHPQVVVENGTFAGLFNYWTLDGFLYGEHLATCPALGGGGRGRSFPFEGDLWRKNTDVFFTGSLP